MITNKIYDFCRLGELVTVQAPQARKTEIEKLRREYITGLLDELGMPYKLIPFQERGTDFVNILVPSSNGVYLCAHYDIYNPQFENANDNSASVINAIAYRQLDPAVGLMITDGEEPPNMGSGSRNFAANMPSGVKWIINLELTGYGKNLLVDLHTEMELNKHILEVIPEVTAMQFPFNDAYMFREAGIDSTCIVLFNDNTKHFHNIHTQRDNLANINIEDMNNFVNNYLTRICKPV
jgi:Iap family predicted aminopeptidase